MTLQASRQRNSSSEGDTQTLGRRHSSSWKEILRLLEGDTQALERRHSGSWKEILKLLEGDT